MRSGREKALICTMEDEGWRNVARYNSKGGLRKLKYINRWERTVDWHGRG